MRRVFWKWWESSFSIEKEEVTKTILTGIIFFFVIGAYTVANEFKDSIFISIVGRSYIPLAKGLAILALIPAILLYSKLVDKMRRYQLLCFYSVAYGIIGLIFAYFVGHHSIGIGNTDQSPYRLFGWVFYFFIEGYSPFVLSVFWAFASSIYSPESAKKGYGVMVAISKLGGMVTSGFAWFLLNKNLSSGIKFFSGLSDVAKHQLILGLTSCFLLVVPFLVVYLMKKIPGYFLHGYEAAYKFEKDRSKAGKAKEGMFAGLKMLVRCPYVAGIFSMIFFYEIFNQVLNFQRLGIAQSSFADISGVTGYLFQQIFWTHLISFFISLFGTSALLRWLGERRCLLLIPLGTGLLIAILMLSWSPQAAIIAYVGIRCINYAFSYPVRESLYIPTVKEMKFKSKSWIDASGKKVAKFTGQTFNVFAQTFCKNFFLGVHAIFFSVMLGLWLVAAFLLGKRFQKAVDNDEVIGKEFSEN